jgi:hypothetical protein
MRRSVDEQGTHAVLKRSSRSQRVRFDRRAAQPTVWVVGPWTRGEFSSVRDRLDPGHAWVDVSTLAGATARIDGGELPPEVLLLAQPRPGVNAQEHLDRLYATAPLVRVAVVAGTWCEGEMRTGRPLQGSLRLYWHELPAWWEGAQRDRSAGRAPPWSLPVEPWAAAAWRDHPGAGMDAQAARAVVAIDARDFATFETLSAALAGLGWRCIWTPRGRKLADAGRASDAASATAGIWDGGQLDPAECNALQRFCKQFGVQPAPVIAMVDFPRLEHLELVRTAGASAIMGKPYAITALAAELGALNAAAACGLASESPR